MTKISSLSPTSSSSLASNRNSPCLADESEGQIAARISNWIMTIVHAKRKTMAIPAIPNAKRSNIRKTRAKFQPSCVDLRMTRQAQNKRTAENPNVATGLARTHPQKSISLASITGRQSKLKWCQRSAKNC